MTSITPFSSVSIVNFEQVNVNWVPGVTKYNNSFKGFKEF